MTRTKIKFPHTSYFYLRVTIAQVTLFLFLLTLTTNIYGQEKNFLFQNLDNSNGLQSYYNAYIKEDSRGLTWISSISGLYIFNGTELRSYVNDPKDSFSLKNNWITSSFYEDSNNDIWFTASNLIQKYNYSTDQFFHFTIEGETDLVNVYLNAFHLDKNGNLWVIAENESTSALYIFNTKDHTSQFISNVEGNRFKVLKEKNDEIIVLCYTIYHPLPLTRLTINDYQFINYDTILSPDENGPVPNISSVYIKDSSRILITSTAGITKFNVSTLDFSEPSSKLHTKNPNLTDIVQLHGNKYILSSETSGLYLFDDSLNAIIYNYKYDPRFKINYKHNSIQNLYKSPSGILWASSWHDGIGFTNLSTSVFDRVDQNFLKRNDDTTISDVKLVENDLLFLTKDDWILKYDLQTENWENALINTIGYKGKKNIKYEYIFKVDNDQYWVTCPGTQGNDPSTVFTLKENTLTFLTNVEGQINEVCKLNSGEIIIGKEEGFEIYSKENTDDETKFEDIKSHIKNQTIQYIHQSFNGNLYFAIEGIAIYEFIFVNAKFTLRHIYPSIYCNGFIEKKNKGLFAISSNGLFKIDTGNATLTKIPIESTSISSQWFDQIIQDNNGDYWITTTRELIRLDSNFIFRAKYGEGNSFYGCEEKSELHSVITPEGDFYIVTWNDILRFNPNEIDVEIYNPKVLVTSIFINEEPIKLNKSATLIDTLNLKYSQNSVSVEFSGLDYLSQGNNKYQYRLKGYESQWVNAKRDGYCRYLKIPSGNFTLELRVSDAFGGWSNDVKRIIIAIQPPWYATWWARTGYILIGLLTVLGSYLIIRNRHRAKLSLQEEKIKQEQHINAELRRVDELKDQFLANTSHELRTPLNGIMGIAETLIEGATGELPDQTKEQLQMIYGSGKRLSSLVNDILDFSKLKNRDIELQLGKVDLRSTGNVVFQLMKPLAESKRLKLINDIPDDTLLVRADENRVQQILFNLIGNAIKFTEKGFVRLSAIKLENYIEISVEDSGIGIPLDKIEDIFNWFEQGDGNVARTYGGTGLGLSVSKHLVELHKGIIRVESEVNRGSIFSFTLPISDDQDKSNITAIPFLEKAIIQQVEKANGEKISENLNHSGIHILTVDDEIVNQKVLLNHLSLSGYKVSQAADGESALKTINEDPSIDAIILDIMMPRMSGYEVCREIRKNHSAAELPIILLTAKNRISDLVKGFEAGANDYLTKPFSRGELLSRITSHLGIREFSRATAKFVPHAFLHKIGKNEILDVKRGDHALCEVSVLFADIRNFTSISETMSPEQNFEFVNRYAGVVGPIVQKHDGFINQYLGDGIMAVFPKESDKTLNAAIELHKEIEKFSSALEKEGSSKIEIGIGFHTGDLVLGIIGDNSRSDPATISDTVNIASRLEGLTKYFGARIIISGSSKKSLPKNHTFNLRFLGKVMVKGKAKAIDVYECFDGDPEPLRKLKMEWAEMFREALGAYFKKDFYTAYGILRDMVDANPQDLVATHFRDHAVKYLQAGVDDDWDGIERMTEK